VIRAEGLRKSFGDVLAVENLTLEFQRGEFFSLLGSGSFWLRKDNFVAVDCWIGASGFGKVVDRREGDDECVPAGKTGEYGLSELRALPPPQGEGEYRIWVEDEEDIRAGN
jgi:hypothetical protein